jgi:gliding motility-associated lipoprotein GldH
MIKGISKYSFLTAISILLLLYSCNKDVIYTDSINIPSELWSLDYIPEFKPEISDTAAICNINLTIRTGTSYPYRNIWLFVNTISPSGKSITDTLQFMLADEKGKWYGKGFGDIHEMDLPFRHSGVFFPEKGTYTFRVRHGMRNENLKGVYDLGLRISKIRK